MSAFSYIALDQAGKESRGVLEADNTRHVRQLLRDQSLIPLQVDSVVGSKTKAANEPRQSLRNPSLKVADVAAITRQLATLVQSGMPLSEALTAVSRQSEKTKVKAIVSSVRSKVLEGHTLAHSLAEFPRAFSDLYRATVAAGEHAGHLELVLNRLADYTESSHASWQKAKLALLYPILLLVISIAVVTGLMAFVVPDVVEVFIGQGQELPALTRALIGISDYIVNYGLITLLVLLCLIPPFIYFISQPNIRLQLDRWLLSWPLIGRLARASNTARYSSTLSILTSSGVPLVDAMKIAGEVLSNTYLKNAVKGAAQQVSEGGSLHRALEQCGYFPPIMIYMIASGEASGELDNMLERVAETQQRELDNLVATLIGIFEPVMLLFMGAAVLIIVVAILQPIFDLNTLI
jgi:general secretion pathway protein F